MEDIRGGQAIDMLRLELWIQTWNQTWNQTWIHIACKWSEEQENLPQTFPRQPKIKLWRVLGASWEALGATWRHLERSWRRFGRLGEILEASWVELGASWRRFGAILGGLGRSWRILEKLLRLAGSILEAFLNDFLASYAICENSEKSRKINGFFLIFEGSGRLPGFEK